jgi:hypothetical protein
MRRIVVRDWSESCLGVLEEGGLGVALCDTHTTLEATPSPVDVK